jgi:hypothetical protein
LRMRGILKIFSENLRLFKVILGFFKDFDFFLDISELSRLFLIIVRDFQRLRCFLNTFLVELRFSKNPRLFENIKRECEASIKITTLFENIFREMEALIRNLRLFEDIFNGMAFLK